MRRRTIGTGVEIRFLSVFRCNVLVKSLRIKMFTKDDFIEKRMSLEKTLILVSVEKF